uniref:Uncharacterized protein n=1 Tax=Chromera velia CCMP2878 TaxID=1169474 RepID=A0A0G4I765_9ALVE|eukprot:Cvel_11581.t1-p1 / transcript=Cvel_11581.t1 / gene=Cvel_11581 / organism=Chromera_velia_CCMP2878 / gene_product=hypothetical protein / transcript_product=hypothetical protein / location=Cvel_scaffold732:37681-39704(-) / protein_length=616 / sequence_SO=supercontig / SO=protein_coding / is_pseudo=false
MWQKKGPEETRNRPSPQQPQYQQQFKPRSDGNSSGVPRQDFEGGGSAAAGRGRDERDGRGGRGKGRGRGGRGGREEQGSEKAVPAPPFGPAAVRPVFVPREEGAQSKQGGGAEGERVGIEEGGGEAAVVEEYWRYLDSTFKTKRKFAVGETDVEVWRDVWKAAALSSPGPAHVLPVLYASLPDSPSTRVDPQDVLSVLARLCKDFAKPNPPVPTNVSVEVLETSVRLLELRLASQAAEVGDVPASLSTSDQLKADFVQACAGILRTELSQAQRVTSLLSQGQAAIAKYQEALRSSQRERGGARGDAASSGVMPSESVVTHTPWEGWKVHPTLGWLVDGEWLDIHAIPKGPFESPAAYGEKLLRLWTLLAFYWAAGAVWPKCRACPQQGPANAAASAGAQREVKQCGEPLLSPVQEGSSATCTYRLRGPGRGVCGREAAWECARRQRGHDAFCRDCVTKQQRALVGSPGVAASTDVYDAVVVGETVKAQGLVYRLKELRSRKPPTIEPNWRTSYRLQPSGMLAVVRLSACGEPLNRESPVEWAETVVDVRLGGQEDEPSRRKRGEMSIRLLTSGDCPGLPPDGASHLERGVRLAVLDLRVFTPEVLRPLLVGRFKTI